ncbi:MAG: hypothetical protein HC922_01705 [Leptolyngbyaceae cyanobacterium SM2_3_12]|nr:hypothetical protein [Leptolyngbyaceae cyanobacterium SM2_3_12]
MSYNFDIIGVSPVLQFFNHQQQVETHPNRSQAYLGSYCCTLDAFIEATQLIHRRPNWDWDAIVNKMVEFWLSQEAEVRHWKDQFEAAQGDDNLIVARIINYDSLRYELETRFSD